MGFGGAGGMSGASDFDPPMIGGVWAGGVGGAAGGVGRTGTSCLGVKTPDDLDPGSTAGD
jgi:hypothetical protein